MFKALEFVGICILSAWSLCVLPLAYQVSLPPTLCTLRSTPNALHPVPRTLQPHPKL